MTMRAQLPLVVSDLVSASIIQQLHNITGLKLNANCDVTYYGHIKLCATLYAQSSEHK